jgi:hypothetical protein
MRSLGGKDRVAVESSRCRRGSLARGVVDVALTKAQRKKLRDAGMDDDALKKLGAILDDDDEDEGDKPAGRRVVVYEGDDADSLIERLFGKASAKDEGDEDDEGDEGDEDQDDAPQANVRWFR